jgi:hypothetical protein
MSRGSNPGRGDFSFLPHSILYNGYLRALFTGVNRLRGEADHTPRNKRTYTSTPAGALVAYRVSVFFIILHCDSGDKIKKTVMGRTCRTYGGEDSCIQGLSGET